MLISGLSYVPIVLLPLRSPSVDGFISMELHNSSEILFSFSQSLFPYNEEDRSKFLHIYPSNHFIPNLSLPIYHPSSPSSPSTPSTATTTNPSGGAFVETKNAQISTSPTFAEVLPDSIMEPMQAPIMVEKVEQRLTDQVRNVNDLSYHTVSEPLSEFIIIHANFVAPPPEKRVKHSLDNTIPTSEEATPFLYSYSTNLTLKIKEVVIMSTEVVENDLFKNASNGFGSSPELFISFRQYGLSYTQGEGVNYIIRGGLILVILLALIPLKYCHTERKMKNL